MLFGGNMIRSLLLLLLFIILMVLELLHRCKVIETKEKKIKTKRLVRSTTLRVIQFIDVSAIFIAVVSLFDIFMVVFVLKQIYMA